MAYDFHYTRRALIQSVIESTKGTDPGSGYDDLLVDTGPALNKTASSIGRQVVSPDFGTFGSAITGSMYSGNYQIEAKGFGTSGGVIVTPEWDGFAQAAALKQDNIFAITVGTVTAGPFTKGETISNDTNLVAIGELIDYDDNGASTLLIIRDAGTDTPIDTNAISGDTSGASATISGAPADGLIYEPTSDETEHKTLTIRHNADGIRKIATYCMGELSITGNAVDLPRIQFQPQGLYSAPTDTAVSAASCSTLQPAPFQGVDWKWGGMDTTTAAFSGVVMTAGNSVSVVNDARASNSIGAILITDANPTLQLTFSQPAISDYNPFAEHEAQTTREFAAVWGSAAGERVRIGVPYAQVSNITESDNDGINYYQLDASANKQCGGQAKWYLAVY